ncbi:TonB family protein [Bacteroidota bacterium]
MRKITTVFLITITFFSSFGQSANQDEVFYKNGIELLDNNNYSAAIYYFNKAIDLNPNISIYYHNRGYAKQLINDLEGALNDYKKASNLVPTESLYFYLIANIYNEQQNYTEAITNYSTAIDLDGTDYLYFFNRGNIFLKIEDYKNAINDYNTTLNDNSNHYGAYNNRAIAKYKLNDIEGACYDWNKAKENGLDISSMYIEKYCSNVKIDSLIEVFDAVENEIKLNMSSSTLPSFNYNGMTEFKRFIQMNIRYPINAQERGHQGKVVVEFYIMKDGSIDSVKIVRSVTKSLDTEALRLIQLSEGHWKPGTFLGKPINSPMTFPVEFVVGGIVNDPSIFFTNKKNEVNYDEATLYANGSRNNIFEYEKFYYDSIWQITIMEKASYYRVAQWDPYNRYFHGKYKDYTIDNELIGEGKYFDNMKDDTVLIYYPSGQLKCKGFYSKNNPIKEWYYYYESGKLWQKVIFKKNSFYIDTFIDNHDSLLVSEGTGSWQMKLLDGDKKFEIVYKGEFKKGKKHGEWIMFHNNEKLVDEFYKNGRFVRGSIYDNEKKQLIKSNQANLNQWIFNPIHLNCSEGLTFDSTTTNANYKFKIK